LEKGELRRISVTETLDESRAIDFAIAASLCLTPVRAGPGAKIDSTLLVMVPWGHL
jgi:hypothetical protein